MKELQMGIGRAEGEGMRGGEGGSFNDFLASTRSLNEVLKFLYGFNFF